MGDLISRETAVAIMQAKADMAIGEVKDAASFFYHCANMLEKLPAVDAKIDGDTSDGYHTFNELYHHRAVLFSVIVKAFPERAWKSRKHHDGTMYDGMFIVGIDTPQGQATYHYDVDPYWEMFACRELDRAPEWDGHTPAEAIARIGALEPVRHGKWMTADGMLPPEYHGKKYCSVCTEFALHDRFGRERLSWFCPFCGAMMDGGEEK
jgi:hypothetical protein|nr:MAG TPA: zinc ribbon domain protein [Caudoviricetes sp.]